MFTVNVEGAIRRNAKWLLILRSEKEEHAGGSLSLVGGKCEIEGNSSDILESTLQRNSSSFVTDSGLNVIDIVFICHHKAGEPYAKSTEEVDDVVWMTTPEILSHNGLPAYLMENIKLAEKLL